MSHLPGNDARVGDTHNRALCCECGTVRIYSKNAGLRHSVTRACSDAEIAHHRPLRPHLWEGKVAWERWLADFKCATCRRVTRHALLRDCQPAYRDWEETDPRVPRPLVAKDSMLDRDATEALLREIRRLEGFGVRFEWRNCGPDNQPSTIEVEQTFFDLSWTFTLNEVVPADFLCRGLRNVWSHVSDAERCENIRWKANKNARYAEFTYRDSWVMEYVEVAAASLVTRSVIWSLTNEPDA